MEKKKKKKKKIRRTDTHDTFVRTIELVNNKSQPFLGAMLLHKEKNPNQTNKKSHKKPNTSKICLCFEAM